MLTYFSRHGSDLAIDEATYKELWDKDLIAIHYPESSRENFDEGDSESIDPSDYSGTASTALTTFNELAKNGGYVCAVYEPYSGGKLGVVEPGGIELLHGHWKGKDRVAVLKTLKMHKVRLLPASEFVPFRAVQPRRGTFVRWWAIKSRVARFLSGDDQVQFDDLMPTFQEVMCSEFLRTATAESEGLPRLDSFALPVGRTLPDIDIYGVGVDGRKVFAQVTYSPYDKNGWKRNALLPYLGNEDVAAVIFFCNVEEQFIDEGITIYPIKRAFDLFCTGTETGRKWLSSIA